MKRLRLILTDVYQPFSKWKHSIIVLKVIFVANENQSHVELAGLV